MKTNVRVIKREGYEYLYAFQIKRKWLPFWITAIIGTEAHCIAAAKRFIEKGETTLVVFEGETK